MCSQSVQNPNGGYLQVAVTDDRTEEIVGREHQPSWAGLPHDDAIPHCCVASPEKLEQRIGREQNIVAGGQTDERPHRHAPDSHLEGETPFRNIVTRERGGGDFRVDVGRRDSAEPVRMRRRCFGAWRSRLSRRNRVGRDNLPGMRVHWSPEALGMPLFAWSPRAESERSLSILSAAWLWVVVAPGEEQENRSKHRSPNPSA